MPERDDPRIAEDQIERERKHHHHQHLAAEGHAVGNMKKTAMAISHGNASARRKRCRFAR